jgi:hypothetical protein
MVTLMAPRHAGADMLHQHAAVLPRGAVHRHHHSHHHAGEHRA